MKANRWLIAAAALVALGAAVWFLWARDVVSFARIGVSYAAQQTCSCLFVSGREVGSCVADFPPETANQFAIAVKAKSKVVDVTAAAGLFHGQSRYEEGYGCSPTL